MTFAGTDLFSSQTRAIFITFCNISRNACHPAKPKRIEACIGCQQSNACPPLVLFAFPMTDSHACPLPIAFSIGCNTSSARGTRSHLRREFYVAWKPLAALRCLSPTQPLMLKLFTVNNDTTIHLFRTLSCFLSRRDLTSAATFSALRESVLRLLKSVNMSCRSTFRFIHS